MLIRSFQQTFSVRDLHENVLRKWSLELSVVPKQAFPGKRVLKPEQAEIDRVLGGHRRPCVS